MQIKLIGAAAVAALLAASVAAAAPPADKGKPPATGATCKPKVSVILRGTVVTNGAPASLGVTVTGGNRFARAYRAAATQPVTILLAPTTKVVRGDATVAASALAAGDKVNVRAVLCKADLAGGAKPDLTAVRVTASAQAD